MDHAEGTTCINSYISGFVHRQNVFPIKEKAPISVPLFTMFLKVSTLTTIQSYEGICFTSMAVHSVILFMHQSTTQYYSQSTSESYHSNLKSEEDHSFTQRTPGINAQDLYRVGFGLLPLLEF